MKQVAGAFCGRFQSSSFESDSRIPSRFGAQFLAEGLEKRRMEEGILYLH
jgi:hypothetical protein